MKEVIEIDENSLENLYKILSNEGLELSIRLSAMDQLLESFPLKNHLIFNNIPIDFFEKLCKFLSKELKALLLGLERDYSEFKWLYFSKTLAFINVLMTFSDFLRISPDIKDFLYNPSLISLLLLQYSLIKSQEIRFQIARFIYINAFNIENLFNFIENKEFFGFSIHLMLKEDFFCLENQVKNDEKSNNYTFWADYYPISSFSYEYLNKTEEKPLYNAILTQYTLEISKKADNIEEILYLMDFFPDLIEKEPDNLNYSISEPFIKSSQKGFMQHYNEEKLEENYKKIVVFIKKSKDFLKNKEISKNLDEILKFISISLFPYLLELSKEILTQRKGILNRFLILISAFLSKHLNNAHLQFLLQKHIFNPNFNDFMIKAINIMEKEPFELLNIIKIMIKLQRNQLLFNKINFQGIFDVFLDVFLSYPADNLYKNAYFKEKSLEYLCIYIEYNGNSFLKCSTFGFLMKLMDNPLENVKILAYNVIYRIFDLKTITIHQNIIDKTLENLFEMKENPAILNISMTFLRKTLDFFKEEENNEDLLKKEKILSIFSQKG